MNLEFKKILSISLFFIASTIFCKDIYVDKNAQINTNNGTSWVTAYLTITDALTNSVAGDVIHIAKGTYTGEEKATAFNISKSLTLLGSYPTGGGSQDFNINTTILDGQNTRRVVNIAKGSNLNGFIIENGKQSTFDGAGLRIAGSSVLENCIIRNNNSIQSVANEVRGGGIYAAFNLTLINCKILNNIASSTNTDVADAKGGGIFIKGVLKATNCEIIGNTAKSLSGTAFGGGLHVAKQADIINCVIAKNKIISNNTSQEAFRLHKIFSSNMVLQRDVEIPFYGYADGSNPVNVTFNGTTKQATITDGKWKVFFPKMNAGGPFELKVVQNKEIVLNNILIGDVFLASGQSNMQFRTSFSDSFKNKTIDFNNDNIRLFSPNVIASKDVQEDLQFTNPIWTAATEQTVQSFSSVGFYFVYQLQKTLNVPIAIIGSYRGSTTADRWMPEEVLIGNDNFKHLVTNYANSGSSDEFKRPSGVYNTMINPLIDFPIKGVIWYQGESDAKSNEMSALYEELFSNLISSWRNKWGYDFPFYYVQLAGYGDVETVPVDSFWARLRESQTNALKNNNTRMVVAHDLGEEKDIHPTHKKPVGERLALQVLNHSYNENLVSQNPLFDLMNIVNNTIEISFSNIGQGLEAKTILIDTHQLSSSKLEGFEICGADKQYVKADAIIVNNKVVVSHPSIPNPVNVRYGWSDFPLCNLYNIDGLPASSFRTDDY